MITGRGSHRLGNAPTDNALCANPDEGIQTRLVSRFIDDTSSIEICTEPGVCVGGRRAATTAFTINGLMPQLDAEGHNGEGRDSNPRVALPTAAGIRWPLP